jgi:hypothetical protein
MASYAKHAEGSSMTNIIPTESDLQPLYDAAKVYGEASVSTRNKYRELQEFMHYDVASKHPELKPFKESEKVAYRLMCKARKGLDKKFPGLGLQCPAPWVGWDGDIEKYKKPVYRSIRQYLLDKYYEANKSLMDDIRKRIRKLPIAKHFEVGKHLLKVNPFDVFLVEKITHNGKRIRAVSVLLGESHTFRHTEIDEFRSLTIEFAKEIKSVIDSHKEYLGKFWELNPPVPN